MHPSSQAKPGTKSTLFLTWVRMDGWMKGNFTSFQSYQDDGRLIMKGPFTVEKISHRAGIELGPLDQ